MRRWAWLLLAAGCTPEALPAEGQLVLSVATDAPLPAADGLTNDGLFDRLRFEIFPPGATTPCDGCRREFGVDREQVAAGQASVGIVPPVGEEGWRVRVRLFRSGGTASSEPRPGSTLDTVFALPPIEPEGRQGYTATLWTDDLARPMGSLEAPMPLAEGHVTGLVGTWPGAERRLCAAPAEAGELCIPGGAFWMGDPRLDLSSAFELDGGLERLVVLSPFYLQVSEVSVPAFRASGLEEPIAPGVPTDNPHEPTAAFPDCTYTHEPGPFEAHPTVCLSWTQAQAYCESIGAELPTEAQLEYAMSGLGRSTYVWGEETPRCEDAVFEREGLLADCADFGHGAAPIGTALRDRLPVDGFEIVDLAGNAREWARDRWQRQDEPCWGTGVFVDPWCDEGSPMDGDDLRVVRGGDWGGDAFDMRAAVRSRIENEELAISARIGFRCARPGE